MKNTTVKLNEHIKEGHYYIVERSCDPKQPSSEYQICKIEKIYEDKVWIRNQSSKIIVITRDEIMLGLTRIKSIGAEDSEGYIDTSSMIIKDENPNLESEEKEKPTAMTFKSDYQQVHHGPEDKVVRNGRCYDTYFNKAIIIKPAINYEVFRNGDIVEFEELGNVYFGVITGVSSHKVFISSSSSKERTFIKCSEIIKEEIIIRNIIHQNMPQTKAPTYNKKEYTNQTDSAGTLDKTKIYFSK